jgi:Ca2+-binding RTX toxin-like protein
MRKTILTTIICLAAFGAQAAAASADASVSASSGDAVYFGDQNKGETLSVWSASGYVHFEDDTQTITANSGCNTLSTHQAECQITPSTTEVRIHGFGGNDVVDARGVADLPVKIWGDSGDDTLWGGGARDELYGGDGNDTLTDGGYGSGFDYIEGDAGNDVMTGSPGADKIVGGDGNDTYDGGKGADVMSDGGDGEDTVTYVHATSAVTVDPNSAAVGDGTAGEGDVVGSDIEDIVGSFFNDTITGTDANNKIDGLYGNDTIDGRGGDDTIHGDDDQDTISGGAGRDLLYGDAGADNLKGGDDADVLIGGDDADVLQGDAANDTLIGDAGTDQLYGGEGDDFLEGGTGNDLIDGGAGRDTAAYSDHTADVVATLGGSGGSAGESDTIDSTNENLLGGKGSDTLTGDAGANTIDGYNGGGNDILDGAGGADTLIGRDGNDTLRSRDGVADTDDCGDGIDNAQVDLVDTVTACETVDAPVVAQGPAEGPLVNGGGQTPVKKAGPKVVIGRSATRKGRVVSVEIVCPKSADGACAGTVALRSGKAKTRATFAIKAGHTGHVKVTLRHGRTAVATATAHDRSSATATTQRRVTIHTARRP